MESIPAVLKLPLQEIHVPEDRQRREFSPDALARLMDSIVEDGLRHPLSVREKDGKFVLVNGERRLRAISNLAMLGQPFLFGGVEWDPSCAPAISDGALSDLAAEAAEYAENEHREPLTWQERAAATARLAGLRRRQAVAAGQPQPSVVQLASEVRGRGDGRYAEDTRRELILSEHMGDPDISKSKTLDEGWKTLVRKEAAAKSAALGQSVGATFHAGLHTLVKADALEWLRACPAEQFDVILTDPPYGMGADSFGDAGGRLVHQTHAYEDSPQGWQDLIGAMGAHWYRVAKPKAHLYVCCDIDGFHFARDWLEKVGWWMHRTPLTNYKLDGSRVPWPEHGPQRKTEWILYGVKGKRPVTRIYSDVIETRGDPNLSHGAQKPVALFKDLLKRSVQPGDRILDCFVGTGTTFIAAHEMMCVATGIENDDVYYGVALQRLKELK